MPAGSPVTLRDLARACGVHLSTISLALKNSPSIPPATRRRIQTVAENLGYRPNVAARNLALLRNEKSNTSLPIAWINQEPARNHWRTVPEAQTYYAAACRRAQELGYHLEEIWAQEPGMSPGRIVQIVATRGIEGVIFPVHRVFDFSLLTLGWSEFSLVGINDQRLGEWLDVVCPNYYHNTSVALRQLRQIGCVRIGLVLTPQFDAASNGTTHACFLRHLHSVPRSSRVPVCIAAKSSEPGSAMVARWLRDHCPDAVICCDPDLAAWGRSTFSPAVWVQLHHGGTESGVDECAAEIACAAVDCVAEKMRRFEKGSRDTTRFHLIKGVWRETRTTDSEMETDNRTATESAVLTPQDALVI